MLFVTLSSDVSIHQLVLCHKASFRRAAQVCFVSIFNVSYCAWPQERPSFVLWKLFKKQNETNYPFKQTNTKIQCNFIVNLLYHINLTRPCIIWVRFRQHGIFHAYYKKYCIIKCKNIKEHFMHDMSCIDVFMLQMTCVSLIGTIFDVVMLFFSFLLFSFSIFFPCSTFLFLKLVLFCYPYSFSHVKVLLLPCSWRGWLKNTFLLIWPPMTFRHRFRFWNLVGSL